MGLSAAQILEVWEDGRQRQPLDRALLVLGAGLPYASWNELLKLPIGQRDAALLELRASTFGDRLELLARCPECDARAELALDVHGLVQPTAAPMQELVVDHEGGTLRLQYRLPDSADLAAVLALDEDEAARRLLARCLLGVEGADFGDALTPALAQRLEEHMAAADPQAEIELQVTCAECGAGWTELLDIGEAFFSEIEREAQRLLGEVDALARVYGWREADILAMSAARRACYLELVGA